MKICNTLALSMFFFTLAVAGFFPNIPLLPCSTEAAWSFAYPDQQEVVMLDDGGEMAGMQVKKPHIAKADGLDGWGLIAIHAAFRPSMRSHRSALTVAAMALPDRVIFRL